MKVLLVNGGAHPKGCTNRALEEVEKALIEYTKDYRNDSSKDLWYDGCGILNKNDYANLKNKAMQSIKEHEGFYISRYEAGIETKKTGGDYTSSLTAIPKSQKDLFVYNYTTLPQAETVLNNYKQELNNNCEISLMFGMQWDLVCKFIEENTSLSKSDILNFNENLGNYSNESKKTGQTSRGGNYSNKGSIASSIQYNDSKIFDKSVGFRIMMIK